jgi:hypothetical protein
MTLIPDGSAQPSFALCAVPRSRGVILEAIAAVLCALLSLSVLNYGPKFSPDSTNYIVAAQNLLEHHTFFVWANLPSRSLEPVPEPYTDYPPGFPIYLVPFLIVFRDPGLAAFAAQAVSILLCYGGLSFIMNVLRLGLSYRVAGHLFLCVFATFPCIFQFLWTEPLFIALSLFCGGFALLTLMPGSKKVYWISGMVLLGLASAVKVIGIFNLAWFVLPIWRAQQRRLALSTLVVLSCVAPLFAWFLRNQLLYGQISRSHGLGSTLMLDKVLVPLLFLKNNVLPLTFSSTPGVAIVCLLCVILLVVPLAWLVRWHLPQLTALARSLLENPGGAFRRLPSDSYPRSPRAFLRRLGAFAHLPF